MKSMSGKELAKLLEANGWDLLRIQGSHHIYDRAGNPARISVQTVMDEYAVSISAADDRIVNTIDRLFRVNFPIPSAKVDVSQALSIFAS